MHEPLTEEALATFAKLLEEARIPPDTGHVAECACADCDRQVEGSKYATKVFLEFRRLDAVGRLLAEPRRLLALLHERDELEAHAEWLRATLLDAEESATRLRAELAADRAAARALVEALPECREGIGCKTPPSAVEWSGVHFCTKYAAPLRALQARMATWPAQTLPERVVDLSGNGNDLVRIDTAALWNAEPATDYEPSVHPSPEAVERMAKAQDAAQSMRDAGLIGPSKVGGTYAEQLGAPKGCLCAWMTQPTATGPALSERGDGPTPCPVHDVSADVAMPTLSLDALEKEQLRAAKDALCDGAADGATARYARKALGLTGGEFASALGYADEAVERWESGADAVPSRVIRGLIAMLGREIDRTTCPTYYVGVDYGSRPSEAGYLRREPDPVTGAPRYYIGEFGDIDEPSVGDVDGYGRRK